MSNIGNIAEKDLGLEQTQTNIDIENEKEEAALKLVKDADKAKRRIAEADFKKSEAMGRKNRDNLLSIADSLVGGNEKAGKAIFLATKALGISDVFIQTNRAAARALADLGPIAGAPVAASIQTSGYISMAAIGASALGSVASSGGGVVSTGGSSGADTSTTPQRQSFEAETTGLQVTDANEQGSSVQTIRFAVDSGDDLIDAISSALNKANSEGR